MDHCSLSLPRTKASDIDKYSTRGCAMLSRLWRRKMPGSLHYYTNPNMPHQLDGFTRTLVPHPYKLSSETGSSDLSLTFFDVGPENPKFGPERDLVRSQYSYSCTVDRASIFVTPPQHLSDFADLIHIRLLSWNHEVDRRK